MGFNSNLGSQPFKLRLRLLPEFFVFNKVNYFNCTFFDAPAEMIEAFNTPNSCANELRFSGNFTQSLS